MVVVQKLQFLNNSIIAKPEYPKNKLDIILRFAGHGLARNFTPIRIIV
jgi:hypothetical protein